MFVPPPTPEGLRHKAVPACTVRELRRRRVLKREIAGTQVLLLWVDGEARAYLDRCPHLGMPLSMGRLRGSSLQCRYHGWRFSAFDGQVEDQPTLQQPAPCQLERLGTTLWGPLVLLWFGEVEARDEALSTVPEAPPPRGSVHEVEMAGPWFLALWNAVDYAHFARHTGYARAYAIYRRIQGGAHVPGTPFRWDDEHHDERSIHFRIPEARRRLRLFAHTAIFEDEGGHQRFETWVCPTSEGRSRYFECYSVRDAGAVRSALLHAAFWVAVVPLLETEDPSWVAASAAAFGPLGSPHLSANDRPLGAYLRRFGGATA